MKAAESASPARACSRPAPARTAAPKPIRHGPPPLRLAAQSSRLVREGRPPHARYVQPPASEACVSPCALAACASFHFEGGVRELRSPGLLPFEDDEGLRVLMERARLGARDDASASRRRAIPYRPARCARAHSRGIGSEGHTPTLSGCPAGRTPKGNPTRIPVWMSPQGDSIHASLSPISRDESTSCRLPRAGAERR